MLAICESLSTRFERGLMTGLAVAEARATLAGAVAGAAAESGFGVASSLAGASASMAA